MSLESTISTLEHVFESSCVELFQSFGCQVGRAADDECVEGVPVAHIDAGSDDLELTIVLKVPHAVLSLSYPDAEDIISVDDAKLEDWISELANQLVGRVKNTLLTYGCRIKIGLPTAFFDAEDEVAVDGAYQRTFLFDIDNELLEGSLYFDIHNTGLELGAPDESESAAEGELELF